MKFKNFTPNGKDCPNKLQRKRKFDFLSFISFVIGAAALSATIWIIIPAPLYNIWLFSVLASEWSFGFGCLTLFGIVCALFSRSRNGNRHWIIGLPINFAALIISFYPYISAYRAAQTANVSLSFSEYFSGFKRDDSKGEYITRRFAEIGGNELQADVYAPPAGTEKNGAGIIVVHGGSWSGGRRGDFPQWNRWLARQGYVVFDVDYRLAPQPNWQTATGDVKCAVAWVRQTAAEFGISPVRLALFGRSAGGQLALLTAYSDAEPRLPASCLTADSQTVRAVVSFYAPTDLIWGFDNPANRAVIDGRGTLSRFLGGNPRESDEIKSRFSAASPINHVSEKTPPTLLIYSGQDQLVRQENMYFLADKLSANRVPHRAILISYAQHGFDYNFNGWGAQVVKPQILEFLREHTK
jgi:acetyl esterase/lipase